MPKCLLLRPCARSDQDARQARMDVEVDAADIVRLMLQFCRENGLKQSLATIQEETGVSLNCVDSLDTFLDAVRSGAWDTVLAQVATLQLPTDLTADLYEQVVLELIEYRDIETARALLRQCPPLLHVRRDAPERYLHMERMLQRPFFDAREAYGLTGSKDVRRDALAARLAKHVYVVAPSRLAMLLGQALRWQASVGALPPGGKLDVFRGSAPVAVREDEATPTALLRTVKFGKAVQPAAIAFAPGGLTLAVGGSDGLIEVYDGASGQLRRDLAYQREEAFMMHRAGILSLAFSSDGSVLASGCQDGRIKVWTLATGKTVRKFDRLHTNGVSCIVFAPDAAQVVSGGNDNALRLLGMRSGNALRQFAGHTSYVTSVVWLPDDAAGTQRIASSSADGTVRVWDVSSTRCLATLRPPQASAAIQITVNCVCLLPGYDAPEAAQEPCVLVCNRSATLFIMTVSGRVVRTITLPSLGGSAGDADVFVAACASPRAELVYGVSAAGTLHCFSSKTGRHEHSMKVHDKEVLDLKHHPLRNLIVTVSQDATLRLWHRPS